MNLRRRHEKIRKASRIARNDPRIREKIKGMEMREDYESASSPKNDWEEVCG